MDNDLRKAAERREDKMKDESKKAFDTFMQAPMTKMAISMIPPTNPPEALLTLLEATFLSGFNAGGGAFAGEMVHAMFLNKTRQQPSR